MKMNLDPKENSDLLQERSKVDTNGNANQEEVREPPDGGFRAYAVVLASFFTNGLLFGVINSCSVVYPVLEIILKEQGATNEESRAALVGALTMGMTFLLSPLSGVLTGIVGIRLTAVLGGTIAALGLIVSSFVVDNINALYFTYSIMYGLGASFAYTPSLAILGHYFKKHLGLVNGLVTVGSSVFTAFIPSLMEYMLNNYGLQWLFRFLGLLTFGVALCGLLFKPLMNIPKPSRRDGNLKSFLTKIINIQIWKNRKYRFWALSMPVALFGYFVSYVHIKKFMNNNFPGANYNVPLQCIAITSGMGRLLFGVLADKPGINKILLQQISFYVIGILTIALPFVRSFSMVVVISLGMGIFDGAFIALIGPIAIQLCGRAYAAQAIGCMLGMSAMPLSAGPPIAAYIHRLSGSYTLPFVLAGISPIVGATLMFSVHFQRQNGETEIVTNGHAPSDVEKSIPLLVSNGNAKQQTAL
ncbi:monocarboxylate transporter 10 [Bombyx mori]|uniref:Major facilitator superfamily (MFS) profile domain-containing protein n=1 Tax=Bombyx mori TaxID=7091 RepID=A0A8R1WE16_BOMMO|nr:monocarboxylate transporter 10 [Bombyx mori]